MRALVLGFALAACGGGSEAPLASEPPAPHELHAPAGVGLGPWVCPPGSSLRANGCKAAGIAPGQCGKGFSHDGVDGCAALLPECPSGQMALPGDASCQPVAPCGSGTWGDIVTPAGTQFVDGTFSGASDGSAAKPWSTVQAAVKAAAPGATIAIAAGVYAGQVFVTKPLLLWGKCPGQVRLSGDTAGTVYFIKGAAGSVLRGVEISGAHATVTSYSNGTVLFDRLWIHDSDQVGITVEGDGPLDATVSRTLIERVTDTGVLAINSGLHLQDSVIRDMQVFSDGRGRGVDVLPGGATKPLAVTIDHSVVERTHEVGIASFGASTAVSDTLLREVAAGQEGFGACAEVGQLDGLAGHLSLAGSLLEVCNGYGVIATSAAVELDRTVIHDVKGAALNGGIVLLPEKDEPMPNPNSAELRDSVIRDVAGFGFVLGGGSGVLDGVVVRDLASANNATYGDRAVAIERASAKDDGELEVRGLVVANVAGVGLLVRGAKATIAGARIDAVKAPASAYGMLVAAAPEWQARASVSLVGSSIAGIAGAGLAVVGSDASVESSWIHGISPASATVPGRGVQVQMLLDPYLPAKAAISRCLVEDARSFGVLAVHAEVALDHTVVRNVARSADGDAGQYGDGVTVLTEPSLPGRGKATLSASLLQGIARAGIASFGADAALDGTVFDCAAIDLDGEVVDADGKGHPVDPPAAFAFDDRGGNACGCHAEDHACAARSSKLLPPQL